ncbi:hypothetical protein HMPREF1869_00003, partial [Bacteroidales bacterium KA00251]
FSKILPRVFLKCSKRFSETLIQLQRSKLRWCSTTSATMQTENKKKVLKISCNLKDLL